MSGRFPPATPPAPASPISRPARKPDLAAEYRFGQLLEGSNRKLAVATYEAAFADLMKLDNKKDAATLLERVVALEQTMANFQRFAELSSELGNRKVAAAAFHRVAQLAAESGEESSAWYERAYQEDSSDQGIALAYGKSQLAQGQAGAAIFILEPPGELGPDHSRVAGRLHRGAGRGGTICRGRADGLADV